MEVPLVRIWVGIATVPAAELAAGTSLEQGLVVAG